MKLKYIYIHIAVMLLFTVAVWGFWTFAYPAHLHFEEQLQLFEFTGSYFTDVIVKPAGLAEYLSRFLVQFFYNGALGPVIMAVLSALVYHATFLLYREDNVGGKSHWAGQVMRMSLSAVPAMLSLSFLMSMDAKPTMVVGLVICLYAVWVTEKLPVRFRIYASAVMSTALAFLVGSIFVVYLALVFLRMSFIMPGDFNLFGIRNVWVKRITLWLIALLLYGAVLCLIFWSYPYPKEVLAKGMYYNRFCFMPADFNVSTWVWTVVIGFVMVRVRPRIYLYIAPLLIVPCLYFVSQQYSADEESMLESMYLAHHENWDEIIERSQKKAPATPYEQTFYNLALAMKGQLADTYFTMQQFGINGLLPAYKFDYMTPLFSADAYYHMGMINTAQRFYYESMEGIPDHQKSGFILKRLTMTALANGRVALARGYLHKLKNTIYYSYWANEMQKYVDHPEKMDDNRELLRLRTQRTKQDSFFDDMNPPAYIAEMLNCCPDNEVAWQYLFTTLMVQGRMDELMQTSAFYSKHFSSRMLPVHVQEALLFVWVSKTGGSLGGFPFKVSAPVGQRFMQFAQTAHQAREIAEPAVRRDYGDTFWCYAVLQANGGGQQQASPVASPQTDGSTGASQQVAGRE